MFEKYNINDLFLASIEVDYGYSINLFDTNVGGILSSGFAGYGYITILKKEGEHYIDLQDKYLVVPSVDSQGRRYTINYMEPLSNYYSQEKGNKTILSRRKSISIAQQYINDFHHSHLDKLNS